MQSWPQLSCPHGFTSRDSPQQGFPLFRAKVAISRVRVRAPGAPHLVDSQADEVMALVQRVADAAAESPEEYRWPTRDESAAVPDPVDNAALIRELLFGKRAAEAAKSSRTRSATEDAWVIWRREENRRHAFCIHTTKSPTALSRSFSSEKNVSGW